MNLQNHMTQTVGLAITNPVIDGQWHSGRRCDGKGADKISYVGHYLPKGLLVRYRHHKQPDTCHVWKEWEGEDHANIDAAEYRRKKEQAETLAQQAATQAAREKARLRAMLQQIIADSIPAAHEHPYVAKKRILAIGGRQTRQRYAVIPETAATPAQYLSPSDLLIPIYDHTGYLQGIQQITFQGRKFVRGSIKDGMCWVGGGLTTGETANRLYIAEGWATAVSIHIRTRNPVIVAFSTSNLLGAGYWARGCYPDTELVYAVDNDIGSFIIIAGKKIENPGKYYAEQAAIAVNAAVIKPPMSEGKSDWNDWHISQILNTRKPD